MAGFDQGGVYYSDSLFNQTSDQDTLASLQHAKKKFKDFIRQYNDGGFVFKYRDQLKKNYSLKKEYILVSVKDMNNFDSSLTQELINRPTEYLAMLEEAVTEVASELVRTTEADPQRETAQVFLEWDALSVSLREVRSEQVSKLVKISGIVINASSVRAKATRLTLQCRGCRQFLPNLPVKPGLDGYTLPRKCPTAQTGGGIGARCPIDPFFIVPDKCRCVDYQTVKLQESPESVPQGELPRHITLYCDRYLCEQIVPGNRVTVVGIYCIRASLPAKSHSVAGERGNMAIRHPFVRVLGLSIDNDGPGRSSLGSHCMITSNSSSAFTEAEEEELIALANSPGIYDRLARSIAPSIYGSIDIKKAIACLMFGGSRKRLPDGLCRRGDINMLLLGDPGTAKSQLLKFVERCAPVGIYTSGKGSSAAGLTASVNRDPSTRGFVIEGGAMVLADGGVVCIDEFDKMREDDRVAIHEAMEQQTISIAKAGITTTLNSRCSVLAAANSVYGRWDETKGGENIDFMPTILSRFDMIFLVRDVHDAHRDTTLAMHVMRVHLHGNDPVVGTNQESDTDEIPLSTLRRFIAYARERCGPRLSELASEKLANQYVLMRSGSSRQEQETGKRNAIPITVRQLEAIVRISEAQAKMRLAAFATEADVEEALRLFQVSTLEASMSGSLEGAEGFTSQEEHDLILRVEKQLKRRFVIGSQVSEHAILQDFTRQGFAERAVSKVLHYMIRRGEIQYRMQRRILYRIK